jgi:hypothetical protein
MYGDTDMDIDGDMDRVTKQIGDTDRYTDGNMEGTGKRTADTDTDMDTDTERDRNTDRDMDRDTVYEVMTIPPMSHEKSANYCIKISSE